LWPRRHVVPEFAPCPSFFPISLNSPLFFFLGALEFFLFVLKCFCPLVAFLVTEFVSQNGSFFFPQPVSTRRSHALGCAFCHCPSFSILQWLYGDKASKEPLTELLFLPLSQFDASPASFSTSVCERGRPPLFYVYDTF